MSSRSSLFSFLVAAISSCMVFNSDRNASAMSSLMTAADCCSLLRIAAVVLWRPQNGFEGRIKLVKATSRSHVVCNLMKTRLAFAGISATFRCQHPVCIYRIDRDNTALCFRVDLNVLRFPQPSAIPFRSPPQVNRNEDI